jgi:hypothetical protein
VRHLRGYFSDPSFVDPRSRISGQKGKRQERVEEEDDQDAGPT